MKPAEVVGRFLAAINFHDVDSLAALMSEDFLFVDSLGNRVNGATAMKSGWQAYFSMCPDYWVRADDIMANGDALLLSGEAGGTIDGVSWKIPSAWKAVVGDGQIREWRVFADNKPVYEIIAKRS
jgi:ketosteroid isomerase-like protein